MLTCQIAKHVLGRLRRLHLATRATMALVFLLLRLRLLVLLLALARLRLILQ
jgi:hypothetical protein